MMERKIRGVFRAWLGILLAVCCMTGCGQEEIVEEESSIDIAVKEEKPDYDLAAGQWTEAGAVEESDEAWGMVEYKEDFGQKTPDKDMMQAGSRSASEGSDYYILEYYFKVNQTGEVFQKYYLTHIDMQTLESQRGELALQEGEQKEPAGLAEDLENGNASISGMDVQDGKVCLLVRQTDRESGTPAHCYAVRLDEQWKVESAVDLLPGLEKAGMCRDGIMPERILCDREGRFYVGTEEWGIFDSTGEFLKMLDIPGGNGNPVHHTCSLPDGRPVFEAQDFEGSQTTIFCLDGLEEKVLYRGACSYAETRYMNAKGEIFYFERGGLLRWNAATGKCERIYRDSSLDPLACRAILETSEDTMILAFYDSNGETFLLRLQRNAEVEEKVLTVYQWSEFHDLAKYADEYSRKHPEVRIEFVTVCGTGDDPDMAMNRLMADMTAGEKPDLFFMSADKLSILQDKGFLAELQELLPGELREQIFPGVLRSGMVEDRLYYMALEASVNTVAVSEAVWPEETWSFRDVMALVENAAGDYSGVFGGESQEMLLYDLVLRDIAAGNSSLVDRGKKECRFDSEEFIRILEFCKKYGLAPEHRDEMTSEDIMEEIHKGKILAYRIEGDLQGFSRTMAALGDGFHCAGFPTEGSRSGYVSIYNHIAMNTEGVNQEEAFDFIKYLLSEPVQRSMGTCTVRRDVLTGNVRDGNMESEGVGGYQYPVFWSKEREVIPLEGKPDGSSFLPEYLEILENGDYMSSMSGDLERIVIEEAGGFFSGDISAEEAAGTIQSRAWVYLNE